MAELGYVSLIACFVIAIGAAAMAVLAGAGRPKLRRSAKLAAYAVGLLATISIGALLAALLIRDFRLEYVYSYTNLDLPVAYTVSALWAGQEGSLLLWAWFMAMAIWVVAWWKRRSSDPAAPYALAILLAVEVFLVGLVAFSSNPFTTIGWQPGDGQGLNPLLQNAWMVVHPPAVFLGYVGFAVPFAFAVASLVTKDSSDRWASDTNHWALFAWLLLGIGNLLGAQWAYVELSFGGYWAWDPVENGSLLPWLVGTALLHSMVMMRKRGGHRVWTLLLAIITFVLCFTGTLLVRSGFVTSVHAFAESSITPVLVAFVLAALIVPVGLLIWRLPALRRDDTDAGLLSKETAFVITNVLFLAVAFVVLWGTLFPGVVEGLGGRKVSLGASFFNNVVPPLFLAIILVMALCTVIRWRGQNARGFLKALLWPALTAVVITFLAFGLGSTGAWVLGVYFIAAFVAGATAYEWLRAASARRRATGEGFMRALFRATARDHRRYGAFIVHLGVALMAVGVVASAMYHSEDVVTLAPGQSAPAGSYTLKYEGTSQADYETKGIMTAVLAVYQDGKTVNHLTPSKVFHKSLAQPQSIVGLHTTPMEDLYVVLSGWREGGSTATFQVIRSGMMNWLWAGGAVLMLGGLVALWPERRPAERPEITGRRRKVIPVSGGARGSG